eukprot:12432668-Alexandrium_andersonii.AAC.1
MLSWLSCNTRSEICCSNWSMLGSSLSAAGARGPWAWSSTAEAPGLGPGPATKPGLRASSMA